MLLPQSCTVLQPCGLEPLHTSLDHKEALTGHPVLQNPKVTADRAFNGFGTNFENSPEPVYGNLFLPRKFKVGLTVPGGCCRRAAGAVNSGQLAQHGATP